MKPFFFGRSEAPLYGVYHPPAPAIARPEGVLLCNAFGQEYMRAHRAFRQVAMLLNRLGFHVMRFDYWGTGDSAGEGEAASVDQWLSDVGQAVDELRALSGVTSLSLIGLRLGATLASYFTRDRSDIDRVVLWNPLPSGEHYILELLDYLRQKGDQQIAFGDQQLREQGFNMNGFPLKPPLLRSLDRLDLLSVDRYQAQRYLMVVSDERADQSVLRDHLSASAQPFTYQLAPSPGNWNFVDNFGGVLILHAIIQGIVGWFQSA